MIKKGGPSRTYQSAPAGIAEVVPWSVPVVVDHIPDTGLHREIEASEAVREAVAVLAEVREVPEFSASFDVSKIGSKVRVTGRARARVGQTCVVSLEPMETVIDEPIDLTFMPPPAGAIASPGDEPRQKTADDGPEPLIGNSLDLGAIASEFLVLAIDPYPRKEGAEFNPPAVENDDPHPFAALEALKKPPDGGRP